MSPFSLIICHVAGVKKAHNTFLCQINAIHKPKEICALLQEDKLMEWSMAVRLNRWMGVERPSAPEHILVCSIVLNVLIFHIACYATLALLHVLYVYPM